MANTRIRDNHTLYIHSNRHSTQEVTAIISEVVHDIETNIIKPKRPSDIRINGVKNKKSTEMDYYAFISSTAVYNIIIGLNPDARPRLQSITVVDNSWTPPSIPKEVAIRQLEKHQQETRYDPDAWGDSDDIDREIKELEKLYQGPPIITITSELPGTYNHPRMVYIKEEEKREANTKWSDLVTTNQIAVERTRLQPVTTEKGLVPFALITGTSVVGLKVTDQSLRTLFAPFSTHNDIKYPIITIITAKHKLPPALTGRAVIRFSPSNNDGMFAWATMRSFAIINAEGKPVTIETYYANGNSVIRYIESSERHY